MVLSPGKTYAFAIELEGLVAGTDWVLVALAQRFPVIVLAQTPPSGLTVTVYARWTGDPSVVAPGETLTASAGADVGGDTSATIVDVAEASDFAAAPEQVSGTLTVMVSLAILAFTFYATARIRSTTHGA